MINDTVGSVKLTFRSENEKKKLCKSRRKDLRKESRNEKSVDEWERNR